MTEIIKVVVDANVLYSGILRGLFLWLAKFRAFQPIWSEEIWNEVIRSQRGTDAERDKFKKIVQGIQQQFPQALCRLRGGLETRGLPDPDDEHVLELAIRERAPFIVTFNLRDFPDAVVILYETKCVGPDDFLCDLHEKKREVVEAAIFDHISNLTKSKPRKAEYFQKLKAANVEKFAAKLEAADNKGELFPEVWDA